MRILVIAHYQNDGSPTAIFVHNQVLEYQKLGHEVKVISTVALGKRVGIERRWIPGVSKVYCDGVEHNYVHYISLSKYGEKDLIQTVPLQ